jgi:hypothetical protein
MTKILFVQKRCERCERLFNIPNIKDSKARDFIIRYTPCSHCFYDASGLDTTGRCLDCSIPFRFVDHKAKGRCHRCLMAHYRKNSTKTP